MDIFFSFFNYLFIRKLIEGEDSRLSTMAYNLSLTGDKHLTASVSVSTTSSSGLVSALESSSTIAATSKADGAKAASVDTQTDGSLEEQAIEMSERKTVLIR